MCHDIISLMVPSSVRIAKSSDFSILKKKKKSYRHVRGFVRTANLWFMFVFQYFKNPFFFIPVAKGLLPLPFAFYFPSHRIPIVQELVFNSCSPLTFY